MKKLHHAASLPIHQTLQIINNNEILSSTDNSEDADISKLEKQILLMADKQKAIENHYIQQINYLRSVMNRQTSTHTDLIKELVKLTKESLRQNQFIQALRAQLKVEKNKNIKRNPFSNGLNHSGNSPSDRLDCKRSISRSRPKILFKSIGAGKEMLKRCKSEKEVESQYFMEDCTGRLKNWEKDRQIGKQSSIFESNQK